ncbi:MAG: hypothetical protein RL186_1632 [Pseudomonadota bacterium]
MSATRTNKRFVAGILLGVGCGFPMAGHAQTISEAVAMALDTSPNLQAQRAALAALGQRRVQAVAQRRVQVSGDANVSYAGAWSRSRTTVGVDRDVTFGELTTSSVSLAASQPIWLAGRVGAALSQADAQIAQADARLLSAEIATMRAVVTAYADLRRDLDGVAIRQQNSAALAQQLEAAQVRFDVGDITKTDVAQVEARYAASKTALASARARADASLSAIARLIGQSPTDVRPALQLSQVPASLQQADILARTHSPDLLAARLGETIAKASARVIEAEGRPRATLQASATGAENQTFEGNRGGNVGVVARFSVPLYTGGITRSRVTEALGNANAARLSALDVERQLVEGVANAWRQVEVAREAIASTEQQVSAARIAFEGAQLEQSVGLRTTLEVLIQQQDLLEAELARAGAQRDLQVATTALVATTGLLTPEAFETKRPSNTAVRLPRATPPEVPLILTQQALDFIPLPSRVKKDVASGPPSVDPN